MCVYITTEERYIGILLKKDMLNRMFNPALFDTNTYTQILYACLHSKKKKKKVRKDIY